MPVLWLRYSTQLTIHGTTDALNTQTNTNL